MLDLHDFTGLDRPRYLPPDCPQRLADLLGHRLHVVGLEVTRQSGQDGLAGGRRVGIGHGNALRSLPVQNVEDVIIMRGNDPDNFHRGIEIYVLAFDAFLDRTGVHHPQGGQYHRDTEKTPGEAVRAGGVTVTVEVLHPFFFQGEKVVELADLWQREPEQNLRFVLQLFRKRTELLADGIKSILQRFIAAV